MTQQEVAKACKFSYGTFRNWIYRNVNPPIMYANRISNVLGVSLDYLVNGTRKNKTPNTKEEVLQLLKEIETKLNKM